MSTVLLRAFAFIVMTCAAVPSTAQTRPFTPAPSAPRYDFPPTANRVRVTNYTELRNAVARLQSDTTIVLARGTYQIAVDALQFGKDTPVANIVIRGETGNRDDVVLLGKGMDSQVTPVAFLLKNAQNVVIADLSVGEVAQHAIEINGWTGSTAVHVYNCRFFNTGEQFIKGNADISNTFQGPDDGIVEYSVFEYLPRRAVDKDGTVYDDVYGPLDGYTNGIDIHDGKRWVIRRNLFKNIRSRPGSPQSGGNSVPAVLLWDGSEDAVVEQNTFINCERAIALGLAEPGKRPTPVPYDNLRGIIRNNFVYRDSGITGDVGIAVFNSPGTKVLHNTVFQNVGPRNRASYPNSIEYRFGTTVDVVIGNNLTDGAITARAGATAILIRNVTQATAAYFADVSIGDLHLARPGATSVIDTAAPLDSDVVTDDWNGNARPYGRASDVGADEWRPAPAVPLRAKTR